MKVINAATIGIHISAHMEGDEDKFVSMPIFPGAAAGIGRMSFGFGKYVLR